MGDELRNDGQPAHVKGSTAYLYSWATVAVCGLAYVGVAATRPDLLGSVVPLAEQAGDPAYASRAVADMADELATLRKWVNDMQHELASTKSAVQDQAVQQTALGQRIAAAEDRLPVVRDAKADGPARAIPGQRVARAPAIQPPANEPPVQAGQFAESTNVRVINPAATAPITTGSIPASASGVAAPGAAPAPVVVAKPVSPRGIEIAAADSLDGLRAKWGDIAGRNTDTLGDLAPRYRLATDGRQAPFTLVAGPFGTPADASRTCAQLRTKGVACRVSDYSGSSF